MDCCLHQREPWAVSQPADFVPADFAPASAANEDTASDLPEDTDLTTIAARAIAAVRLRAGHVGFDLHPLPSAVIVRRRVHEVFVALLEHALTYTRDVPSPRIVIGVQGGDQAPEIVVQDNGVGFDTCASIRVLDPDGGLHFAGDDDSALGRVRRLVALQGGRLRVQSAAWGGTTFSFTLGPGRAAPPR
jgi:signal transduction histidine kinase